MVKGSCLCGTVRYEASGPFEHMLNCHCSMCRKHHGAPFATFVSAPIGNFRWTSGEDAIVHHRSSEQGMRSSCRVCGSPLPESLPSQGLALLLAGPLEGELGITPQAHMFVGSKAPWYPIADNLPRHAEYPPELGTRSVERPTVQARPGVTSGSCLCGDVAFEIDDPALFMQNCHCSRCRRARGAAHGTNIFYKADQFRWIRGEELVSEFKLPESRYYNTAFCHQCGSALPKVARERNFTIVPAGCLDTDPPLRPQRHIFTSSKVPWFQIADGLPQFTEGAPRP